LDILVRPTAQNARRLIAALAAFGFASVGLTETDFTNPGVVVQLGVPPARIDLITSLTGVSTDQVFEHCVQDKDEEQETRLFFISKEDLIANKRATGRPQDLADLDHL
jgi:hypothetical protein